MWKTPVAQEISALKRYTEGASNEAAPAGNRGLTTNDFRGVEMADTNGTGSWLAHLDGCPKACGNAELPYGLAHTPNSGDLCLYKCTTCGARWHTSWKREVA